MFSKFTYLINNVQYLPKVFITLSVACAVASGVKISKLSTSVENISKGINNAVTASEKSDKNISKKLSRYKESVDKLKEKNIFMPPSPAQKENPVKIVNAIMGNQALLNGGEKWYKAGDKIQDAEIKEITPEQVTVNWNDNESVLHPFDVVAISNDSNSPKKHNKLNRNEPRPDNRPQEVQFEKSPAVNMSPDADRRSEMRERLNNMTPEQRREYYRRWRNNNGQNRNRSGRGNSPGRSGGERRMRRNSGREGGTR